MAFQLISAREAESLMDHWEYVVIDLRNDRDYRKGHMQGALNLPYEFLDHYMGEKIFPKCRRYILYCSHGGASMLAGRRMSEQGLDVLSISGGILSYRGRLFV